MIWALVAALLFGSVFGGTTAVFLDRWTRARSALEQAVRDPVRRARADELLGAFADQRVELVDRLSSAGDELGRALAHRGASRLEVQALLDEIELRRATAWKRQVELRFELRGMLTADEWRALFPAGAAGQPGPGAGGSTSEGP